MKDPKLGQQVRDSASGVMGRVVGIVTWEHTPVLSLIVQPPARQDGTVPPTVYVPESMADPVAPSPRDRQ